MPLSKKPQRGATLTGYALILSAFTVMSLGAVEGLNSASGTYLEETSGDIAAPRELSFYDEMEEIPEPDGDGGDTGENIEDAAQFDLADGGQVVGTREGYCVAAEADGRLRMRECDGALNQEIEVYLNSDSLQSQLRIGGKCIGVQNNSNSNGDPYILEDCDDDDASQLFNRVGQEWQSVVFDSPQMCLDSGGAGEGRALHQWTCGSETNPNANQQWADPAPYVPPFAGPPTPTITGQGTFVGAIPDGADFAPDGAFEDNDNLFIFTESVIELGSDLTVNGATIPAGTRVCSYIFWYDPVNSATVPTTTVDFGGTILAMAGTQAQMQATDQFGAPGVNYRDYNRPLEGGDVVGFSGSAATFNPYAVPGNADMARFFIDCSDEAAGE